MGFEKIDEGLFGIFRNGGREFFFTIAADAEDVEDEQTVIGRDGAAAFGDDVRVRDFGLVADALDVIDNVAGVFFECIVDARFKVGLRTIVIYAETAADVDVAKAGAGLFEIDINARGFDDGGFDLANVGDLAAEVEVGELEAIFHAALLEVLHGFQSFADGETEFGAITA